MAQAEGSVKPDAGGLSLWYLEHRTEHTDNQLTIYQAGVGVQVSYSIKGMPLRGLGGYHLPVSANDPDVGAIRAEVERLLLYGTQPRSDPPTMGMRTKVLRMSLKNRELNYLLNADAAIPPELEPITQAIGRLMARAAKHPLMTLSASVALSPSPLHVGDPLTITVELKNDGRNPLALVSPASFSARGANSFRLNFWRPTGDAEEPYEYEWTLDLLGHELLIAEHTTLASKGAAPIIEAGAALKAWTTVRMPRCRPGEYLVELVYSAVRPSEQPEGDRRIFGELHADGVPLIIAKKRK